MVTRRFNSVTCGLIAAAEITGGVAPVFVFNRGFTAAIVRNGAGDITLVLDNAEAFADAIQYSKATVKGTQPQLIAVEHQSNTQIRVRTASDLGVAVDTDFAIEVRRVAPI